MNNGKPILYEPKEIQTNVDTFSKQLGTYLNYLDLPTDNVLVDIKERGKVIYNMPTVIMDQLTDDQRKRAYYVSKFIASCAVGLFDAALNFLWNETILNLREKIIRFDLDYFFDSTIGSSERAKFRLEEDLEKIEDWQLIRGCRETGIISGIGYKHLDYIRDMRNFASAAHPNQNQLTGLQLVSWLETCIIEVLAKEPSGPVLEVKKLLFSIREEKLDPKDIKPVEINIQQLPKDLVHSLLRAIFGMYTDTNLSQNVRNNIDLIAKCIWDQADDEAKHKIGLKYAVFSANAELKRKELANQFLNIVDGLMYLTENQKAVELNERLENLSTAHYEFNNFCNEEPHAKIILKYIPNTGKIPDAVRFNYVKTLTICRLGNSWGISNAAKPYYDKMINMFNDPEILSFLELLKDNDITTVLQDKRRLGYFFDIAKVFYSKTNNAVIKRGLSKLLSSSQGDIVSKKTYWGINKLIKQ